MRHLLLVLVVLFVGCADEIIPNLPPSLQGDGEHTLSPVVEPQVDKTFMDQASVEAWRGEIAESIDKDAVVPHPRDIWRYAADFHVDRSKSDPILGDPTIWDAARVAESGYDFVTTDVRQPRADEALALEVQDQEWTAAELWIAMGRLDDAMRCSAELEKEGEWKAVAMIAVHTGDFAVLDRATKNMVGAEQVSRTRNVASYAFLEGKIEAAKHIAAVHGWSLTKIINNFQIRALALKGDASLLLEVLDSEIAAWEENSFWELPEYPGPQIIVADIVILGKTDQIKAKQYASRYLKLSHANVLIWTRCGEGCFTYPVRGTHELYQLVRADKTLRELYFTRVRQAMDDMFPVVQADGTAVSDTKPTISGIETDSYIGWSPEVWENRTEGNLLNSYLIRVRQMGDREFTAFWVAMLDTFPSRSGTDCALNFEREIGRCALGFTFYKSVEGITLSEKFILEELSGGANTRMDDTWAAWDKELPSCVHLDEVSNIFYVLSRGDVSPRRESTIRAELDIQQTMGEMTDLRDELRGQFRRSLDAHYGDAWMLKIKFEKAQNALRTNVGAQELRRDNGLPAIELYPDTDAEYNELMAPSIALLCEKLPAKCQLWPRFTPVVAQVEPTPTETPTPITTATVTAAPSTELDSTFHMP